MRPTRHAVDDSGVKRMVMLMCYALCLIEASFFVLLLLHARLGFVLLLGLVYHTERVKRTGTGCLYCRHC